MSTLNISGDITYQDGFTLFESQLDEIKLPLENFFSQASVDGENIQDDSLDGSVVLLNNAITPAALAPNIISSRTIQNGSVTSAVIDTSGAVSTDKIEDEAVTSIKVLNSTIATSKIADETVPKKILPIIPRAALALPNLNINVTGAAPIAETLVGSLTVTGLVTGRPLIINLQGNTSGTGTGYMGGTQYSPPQPSGFITIEHTSTMSWEVILKRDGNPVHYCRCRLTTGFNSPSQFLLPLSTFTHIDVPSSSSHTYTVHVASALNSGTWSGATKSLIVNQPAIVAIQII